MGSDNSSNEVKETAYIGKQPKLMKLIPKPMRSLLPLLVWPLIVILPLSLTYNYNYRAVFPKEWYDETPRHFTADETPSPLGLTLGILAVVVGHIFTLIYFISFKFQFYNSAEDKNPLVPIQKVGAPPYTLLESLVVHLSQPEGFVMLGGYLILTWMLKFMPASYYSFEGGIIWKDVFLQLLLQDFIQFAIHYVEHKIHPYFYQVSHKPHHRFINPKFFDAFNGSFLDTFCMILIPLFITKSVIHTNVWSYMAFGSLYANWLTLIHSEYVHLWDGVFRLIGFGTAADHHVHHKVFKYNYGHLFMYWDKAFQTYMNPRDIELFNKGV